MKQGETGKYPLSFNIYTQIIKYWIRLLSTESLLLQEAHMDNIERCKRGQQCWLQTVVYILNACGIHQIEVMEICKKQHAFLRNLKERLAKLYKQKWETELEEKKEGKLSFYYEVKRNFQFEGYLDNIERRNRKEVTKFRLSNHKLPVERMRYGEVDREDRKCTVCNRNEVGDEWHYLTKCANPMMLDSREQFVQKIKTMQPQLETFETREMMKYCLTMHDDLLQMETALYVKNLLQVYSDCKEEEESTCSLM